MIKYLVFFLLSFSISTFINAQIEPVAHYSFDQCSLSETMGNYSDAVAVGSLICDCGVRADGALFGTGIDSLLFPVEISSLFSNDFTLSFYAKFDNLVNQMDILSVKSSSCQVDSSFSIKYVPITDQIDIEIGEDFNDIITLSASFDHSVCWHHIVLSKKGQDYFFFYNDVIADQIKAIQELVIDPSHVMAISNSACLGVTDSPYAGKIDELSIYDQFLDVQQLVAVNLKPDQIIKPDTTVFLGDGVQIVMGGSCDQSPTWSPSIGVDMIDDLEPFITPIASTTYSVLLDYDGCTTIDSIAINIIDPNQLDCGKLLLANAFTPNGDNLNDDYGISNSFIIDELITYEIYDRWGEIVFESNDKNDRWDATYKNAKLNPGMFLYIVKYTCQEETFIKSGNVSILR